MAGGAGFGGLVERLADRRGLDVTSLPSGSLCGTPSSETLRRVAALLGLHARTSSRSRAYAYPTTSASRIPGPAATCRTSFGRSWLCDPPSGTCCGGSWRRFRVQASGRRAPRRSAEFGALLNIDTGHLAAVTGIEPSAATSAPRPAVARLIWDVRELTADQLRLVTAFAERLRT
jgi:hypothetical protein